MLDSSTCPDAVTNAVADALAQQTTCDYTVTQTGDQVTAVDCNDVTATGEIDAEGVVHIDLPAGQQTQNGCTVTVGGEATVNVSHSPTTLQQIGHVTFAGTCPLPPCQLVIQSRWTKL